MKRTNSTVRHVYASNKVSFSTTELLINTSTFSFDWLLLIFSDAWLQSVMCFYSVTLEQSFSSSPNLSVRLG